jgi:vancomycin resistance protein YoaR
MGSTVRARADIRTRIVLALTIAATMLGLIPAVGGAVVFAGEPVPVLLGQWRVNFTPSRLNGWGVNIRRPAEILNGKVIQPGARLNYARATGPFTEENGYRKGAAIVKGKLKMDAVIGGGLCSNVTAVFNAAARAGLQINQRYNHTFYISRYPVGLDATVWVDEETYSGKNMIFTNDTASPITIKGFWGRRWVRMEVWGLADGRTTAFSEPNITNRVNWTRTVTYYSDNVAAGNRRVISAPGDGFDSMVTRTVRAGDATTVLWTNNYFSHYKKQTGMALLGRYPGDPAAGTVAYVTE